MFRLRNRSELLLFCFNIFVFFLSFQIAQMAEFTQTTEKRKNTALLTLNWILYNKIKKCLRI